jgi:hypothetical protein
MNPTRFTPLAVLLVGSVLAVSASPAPSRSAVLDQRVPAFLDRHRNDWHDLTALEADGRLPDLTLGISDKSRER